MVAVNRHFVSVGVDNRKLLQVLAPVIEVDTNTTRNQVVVVSLEDVSGLVAAIGTESIVVARRKFVAQRDLVQAQVTVNGVAAQVTALTPERVAQVDSGLRTHVRQREEASGNAISVVSVGRSTATARRASSSVAASRERVTLATSTLKEH